MKLQSVQIKNYRSIEDISFDTDSLDDGSFTYGLIGINEAGKSSILKALALKDGSVQCNLKDFRDGKPVEVIYFYKLDDGVISEFKDVLTQAIPTLNYEEIKFSDVCLKISFEKSNPTSPIVSLDILNFEHDEKNNIQENLKQIVLNKSHKSIFWTAEERYLISQPIDLGQFVANPNGISVPLKNCFSLAGISNEEIPVKITELAGDSTAVEELQINLGEAVTEHIRRVWPKHPIEITFLITDGLIHFHVKDLDVRGKSKTADQRSDGFKQFTSFLLTVSAENINNELSNSSLLLDEPETHLHPQAQKDLLQELIKITKNKNNNIVFFATHSNYMIDKDDLSRNYKIKKPEKKDTTEKKQFDKKNSTYASVTYEVFEIASSDYHDELYGFLHAKYIEESADENEEEKRSGITNFDKNILEGMNFKMDWIRSNGKIDKNVTLATYIRNYIHHPEAQSKNTKFTDENLRESIEFMLKLKYEI